ALPKAPAYVHAANSAALLRDSRVWYDRVRPGLLLYGLVPPPLASTLDLTPVMTLTSRVVAVKGVRPGEGVGYGSRFRPDAPARIAIVPAGYADGLDVRLGGLDADTGDEVVIVGAQGGDRIDVREMAARIGTIPYEMLCRVGSRIERVYS